ncbi:hypothetical protein [Nostoc sp. TCL240-02]|uniref:hypothetical protein n=1 Tax=Nostoc sp. TCL240-02 TaxID=2572090 RepID=UPI00157F88AE|nr:hypothetical protein [Nostoc sp. TCL240-02]QKQ76359.1 hypothetical protein FBB35_26480 [Nostoc sp. TCL240-02]
MKYRELQSTLKVLKNEGNKILCRLDSDYSTLEAEYLRLTTPITEVTSTDDIFSDTKSDTLACHSDERSTNITVLEVSEESREVVLGIHSEYRIIPVYWDTDDGRDTAISVNREVVVNNPTGNLHTARINDCCKIEVVGDGKGNYRAFPMSSTEGYVEWLLPDVSTKFHTIKAKLSTHDTHSRSFRVSLTGQYPDLVSSEDIIVCRTISDEQHNITRYFPSVGTFLRVGSRWLLAGRSNNVEWISTSQAVKSHHFKVGDKVLLQHDIGLVARLDYYRIDKIFYSSILLMAQCTNERTGIPTVVPIVQLHLPKKGV